MRRLLAQAASAALLALIVPLAGCSSAPSHEAACLTAVRALAHSVEANPSGPAAREPAACKGLPGSVIRRIGVKVMGEMWNAYMRGGLTPPASPSPSPTPDSLLAQQLRCTIELDTVLVKWEQLRLLHPDAKLHIRTSQLHDCVTLPEPVFRRLVKQAEATYTG